MDGTPQPIVPDRVEALGQYRLQKAPDELVGRQRHGLPALVLGLLLAEADVAVLDREHPALGQRDPVAIATQGVQDLLRALDGGFAVDDPPLAPDRLGDDEVRPCLTHQRPKQSTEELGEGMDGHQGGRAGRAPLGPVGGDPSGRDQAGHVRMVGEGTGPGLEDTQDPHEAADIVGVRRELQQRWGRRAEHNVIAVLWVTPDEVPQLVGPGEDDVNVGDRQQFLPPLLQPCRGILAVAFWATAVATGVVDIRLLATVITLQQVPAQGFRATVANSLDRPPMAGEQILPAPLQVRTAITPKDSCSLWHGRSRSA